MDGCSSCYYCCGSLPFWYRCFVSTLLTGRSKKTNRTRILCHDFSNCLCADHELWLSTAVTDGAHYTLPCVFFNYGNEFELYLLAVCQNRNLYHLRNICSAVWCNGINRLHHKNRPY